MALYTVLYDAQQAAVFDSEIRPLLADLDCDYVPYQADALPAIEGQNKVILWLGDEPLCQLLPIASERDWQVGFLPHPDMQRLYRTFSVSKKPAEALADITGVEEASEADLMYCNEQLVLGSVMLGDSETMAPAAQMEEGLWSKLKHLILLTFNLSRAYLCAYTLETAKQSALSTAALGITIVYRPSSSDFTKRVVGETEQDESSLNAIILAPRSLIEVVHFLLGRFFPKEQSSGVLPDYIGHIKTESIKITGRKELNFYVNGELFHAEQIEVKVQSHALKVLSSALPERAPSKEQKESIRISGLPKGNAVDELINRPLPWIHHADQDEVKETFITLKENARSSESYLVLMVLSTMLATVGLFANSAPVIIGAMILAPLMAPIISLSMGVLRQNTDLITESGKTLFTGVLLALLFATLLTLITPLHTINHEIDARLSPTILDLGVAIISGIAGAYASARSEVAKSLAGVAIAVALVPPLAVSGIGIGWLDINVFWGAFLLFITNLIGIVLAASITFLLMGFSPFHLAKKGVILTLAFVGIISIPLGVAFDRMVEEQGIVNTLQGWKMDGIRVADVKVRSGRPDYVSVKLLSRHSLTSEDISQIKQQMEAKLGQPILLEATLAVVR